MTQKMLDRLRAIRNIKLDTAILRWLEYLTLERRIQWDNIGGGTSYDAKYLGTRIYSQSDEYFSIDGYITIRKYEIGTELNQAMKALRAAIHQIKAEDFIERIKADSDYFWE